MCSSEQNDWAPEQGGSTRLPQLRLMWRGILQRQPRHALCRTIRGTKTSGKLETTQPEPFMTGKNYSALSVERGLLSVPVLLVVLGIPTLALAQDVVARSAVQLHIDQSVAYYTHGDLRHAIGELQVAQQLAPADLQVNFMLGNALYRYGDNTGAAAAYGNALAIKPDHFG